MHYWSIAGISQLVFTITHYPVYIGDVVFLKAGLNLVGKTSMEVGVLVELENPQTGETRHTASAFLTYVALDKDERPTEVPPLILETDEEKRCYKDAQARREDSMEGKGRISSGRLLAT